MSAPWRGRLLRAMVAVTALVAGACVSTGSTQSGASPSGGGDEPRAEDVEGRITQGSLRQDEITVELRSYGVQVRLTPLAPEIVRLTAPDTRRRLESLGSGSGDEVRFLVSVFTEDTGGAEFEPRSVTLENRGRVFRPSRIRALTPGWGVRLEQRRVEQAVYSFPGEVDLEMPLTVAVHDARSGDWAAILSRIDAERARVRARGGDQPSRSNFRILR